MLSESFFVELFFRLFSMCESEKDQNYTRAERFTLTLHFVD